jgi:hypothetical protein
MFPFDVELLSPGMLTADQILPRLDRRLTHFSPVDPLLQTAETALNRVEAVGRMRVILCHVLIPARVTPPKEILTAARQGQPSTV